MADRLKPLKWPLVALTGWLKPRSEDPEESFREAAIRLILPLVVIGRAFIIWYRHIVQGRPVPPPLTVGALYALCGGLAALSLAMLLRQKIVLSAVFLILIQAHADILGIVVNGYWNTFTQMSLMVNVLAAALLLSTWWVLPYALLLVGIYGALAHLPSGFWHPALPTEHPGELVIPPGRATATMAASLLYVVALAGFVRREVERRMDALAGMVATLEERVGERTAELTKANVQLLALSRVKDEFVSNVSHEIRTPLTNLNMQHHLLKADPDPEGFERHLAIAEREVERLSRIIEDLLRLSRLDQQRTDLRLETVDLNGLVGQFVSDRVWLAESKGLRLTFEGEAGLPEVRADGGLVAQVLNILLTNALNYTPEGGRVVVSTQARRADGRQWATFSVRDSGPGIPAEERGQMFERFFRGQVGKASGEPGTGLGLAIAQEIVTRHAGRIEVASDGTAGEGATFGVWLPVGDAASGG